MEELDKKKRSNKRRQKDDDTLIKKLGFRKWFKKKFLLLKVLCLVK